MQTEKKFFLLIVFTVNLFFGLFSLIYWEFIVFKTPHFKPVTGDLA